MKNEVEIVEYQNLDQPVRVKILTALFAAGGMPVGGKTGQILAKNSDTDYDTKWIDNEWTTFGLTTGDALYSVVQRRLSVNGQISVTKAYQRGSMSIGGNTQAGISFEEWKETNPQGTQEEYDATFSFAFAQGEVTQAKGRGAASFNLYNQALGDGATSHGWGTTAESDYSFVAGRGTYASAEAQMAVGTFNAIAYGQLFTVGNGTDENNRSTAFYVTPNGEAWVQDAVLFNDGSYIASSMGQYKQSLIKSFTTFSSGLRSTIAPKDELDVVRLKELTDINTAIADINKDITEIDSALNDINTEIDGIKTDLSDNYVDLTTEQTITGIKRFNAEVFFNTTEHSGDSVYTDCIVKFIDTAQDIVTKYSADEIVIEKNGNNTYNLKFPDGSGVFILDTDLAKIINLKHSKIANVDSDSQKEDAWFTTDLDAAISIYHSTETENIGFITEAGYTALQYSGSSGVGRVSVGSNVITIEARDTNGHQKTILITPENATLDGNAFITSLGGTFENKPVVKENGTTSPVALMSDLTNYVPIQSESEGYYTQVTNALGAIAFRIFQNGDEDIQSLIINKDGVFSAKAGTAATSVVIKSQLDTKFDKAGGAISGNVEIGGNLTVKGTEYIQAVENLTVKNPMIYTNADKATLTDLGGLGININATDTYGFVYDPVADSVRFGLGKSDANGKFTFNTGEGLPVAIRDDSENLTNDHLIKWNAAKHAFVDSAIAISDVARRGNTNTFTGTNTFNGAVQFNSDTRIGTTLFTATSITEGENTYEFPEQAGTMLVGADLIEMTNDEVDALFA